MSLTEVTLAIEIGGTHTSFGLFDITGNCFFKSKVPAKPNESPESLFDRLFNPGDDAVDWWSINFFSPSNITDSGSADGHNRPVLIGEATPQFVGVLDGQKSWDTWFVPYFNLIRSQPGIKMISYINWNWAGYPQWSKWGDARLEANDVVKINFNEELANSIYFHAGSEADLKEELGYNNLSR